MTKMKNIFLFFAEIPKTNPNLSKKIYFNKISYILAE